MPNYKGCPFCGDIDTDVLIKYDGMTWYAHEECCKHHNNVRMVRKLHD